MTSSKVRTRLFFLADSDQILEMWADAKLNNVTRMYLNIKELIGPAR